MRKWIRERFGALVPAPEKPEWVDPLETHADRAAAHYGFTDEERAEYLALQRRLAGNPALMKKLIRRQKKFMQAARMSPTIKSRPTIRSRRSR